MKVTESRRRAVAVTIKPVSKIIIEWLLCLLPLRDFYIFKEFTSLLLLEQRLRDSNENKCAAEGFERKTLRIETRPAILYSTRAEVKHAMQLASVKRRCWFGQVILFESKRREIDVVSLETSFIRTSSF